jgi:hypothetical protein
MHYTPSLHTIHYTPHSTTGECFLYTNSSGKLNYLVGGEVMTLCHLSHPMYLLGTYSTLCVLCKSIKITV